MRRKILERARIVEKKDEPLSASGQTACIWSAQHGARKTNKTKLVEAGLVHATQCIVYRVVDRSVFLLVHSLSRSTQKSVVRSLSRSVKTSRSAFTHRSAKRLNAFSRSVVQTFTVQLGSVIFNTLVNFQL